MINQINKINDLKIDVIANKDNGMSIKEKIVIQLEKRLKAIDKSISEQFIEKCKNKQFKIIDIKINNKTLSNEYLVQENSNLWLTYNYIFENNKFSQIVKLNILYNYKDFVVFDEISKLKNLKIILSAGSNINTLKQEIKKSIIIGLSQECCVLGVLSNFEKGNFEVISIKSENVKTDISNEYLKKGHLPQDIVIGYNFNSLKNLSNLQINLAVKNDDKVVLNAIKSLFPEEIVIPRKINLDQFEEIVVDKIKDVILNSNSLKQTIKWTFKTQALKNFKISTKFWDLTDRKFVEVNKFKCRKLYNRKIYQKMVNKKFYYAKLEIKYGQEIINLEFEINYLKAKLFNNFYL